MCYSCSSFRGVIFYFICNIGQDVTRVDVKYKRNGTACVTIVTIPETSKFYATGYWIKETTTDTNGDEIIADAITWKDAATQYKSKSC